MRIAVVGGAPSSRSLAPFDDPTWQIWTCSPSNAGAFSRVDAWFELHALIDLTNDRFQDTQGPYYDYLRGLKCPVYMQEKNNLIPDAIVFPREEIVSQFSGFTPYTSSMAWMVAYAITKKPEEIGIWGVDCCAASEYEYERPGVQFWLAEARKRGINVVIPPQSDLWAPIPEYGYGDRNPLVVKLKMHTTQMRDRIAKTEAKLAQNAIDRENLLHELHHLQGGIEENVYIRRTFHAWSGVDPY